MKYFLLLFFNTLSFYSFSQKDTSIIRLEKELQSKSSISDKIEVIFQIASSYSLTDPKSCEETLNQGIFIAEQSRDKEMMVKARRFAGNLYSQISNYKGNDDKAMQYTQQALELSQKVPGIEKEKVLCNVQMAKLLRNTNKGADALKYNQAAVQIAQEFGDDSILVSAKLAYGGTQLANGDKLDAFKTYVGAEAFAEKSKHPNKEAMLALVNSALAKFYASIENYDRALDYQYEVLKYDQKSKNLDRLLGTIRVIGHNFLAAKKYDQAIRHFEYQIKVADSLKNEEYNISGQIGIANALVDGPESEKALQYFQTHPQIRAIFMRYDLMYQFDFGMAQMYNVQKRYDSAQYYFEKSFPIIEKRSAAFTLPDFYVPYANFLYGSKNYNKAILYLKKSIAINDSLNNSINNKDIYLALDSCYQKTEDFRNAFLYNSLYEKAKLETEEKAKAKDILAVEIDAENKRQERLKLEAEEAAIARHNWQYMLIVVGILSLFILLAIVGIFNVPLKWVRALGFISFIFLFEFIILLADTWIHHTTHGEPWKVLAIKVVLIAALLPLHHYLEHKAIHYITNRRNRKLAYQEVTAN